MRLSIVTLLLFLSRALGSQEIQPEPYFYVISVPPPPGFDDLPSLKERADSLEQFILPTYKADKSHLRILTTKETTTAANIRQLLYGEIPSLPVGSIIFVFLLTHGELERFPNASSKAGYDLQIVASDTSREEGQWAGTTIHGSELINAFSHAPRRSIIFAFLDSCSSGALGAPLNKMLAGLTSELLESRMLVMTSSALGQPSYGGDFTQAILDVWKNQGVKCIRNDYFTDALNERLAVNGQEAQAVVPFSGPCINFANEQIGLLVVTNNTKERIVLRFPDGIGDTSIGPDTDSVLVPVPRKVKSASVFSGKRPIKVLEFDLSEVPITRYQVAEEADTAHLIPRYLKEAERVAEFGFERDAQLLKVVAAGFARTTGDESRAQEIETTIDRKVAAPEVVAVIDYYQNLAATGIKQVELGDYLATSGRFSAAYSAYSELFEHNKKNSDLFGNLYTSLALAGKAEAAKELRLQNPTLFQLSAEAQETRSLLNLEDKTSDAAAVHGLENAAARLGIVVKERIDLGIMTTSPP